MSAAIDTVAPKLGKLIPLLGSNHDGEVLSAAAAIRRTLDNAGLDLNDLAETISAPGYVPQMGRTTGPDLASMFTAIWQYNPPSDKWAEIIHDIHYQHRAGRRLSFKQRNLIERFHKTAMANRDAGGGA